MTLTLPPGEPAAGPWRTVPVHELIDDVRRVAGDPAGRPRIVAVDGRGASGKTTLAARLHQHLPAPAVVHTDDLAWHEPLFGWGHLLADRVLQPLRRGEPVSFQPPAWAQHGRDGAVQVPAGPQYVLVEGSGAAELYLGLQTVKTHVSSLLRKLGARDRTLAVIAAYESGLVPLA